jgi:2-methylcitrate dehydratase
LTPVSSSPDLARRLSEYSASLRYESVPGDVIHEAKRRILDSLGCAIAAFDAEPVKIGRKLALESQSGRPSTILGTRNKTTLEMAAFVGVMMGRRLDFNDGYHGPNEDGHGSDNVPLCLAVSSYSHRNGKDLLLSVVMAYEVQLRFADVGAAMRKGWDDVNYYLISSTIATARLLGLSTERATQALNISLNSHIGLRQVRIGEISMWKGCASAEVARCAVFSALLAAEGMTGPSPIFEGEFAFFKQVMGPADAIVESFGKDGEYRMKNAYIKFFPSDGGTQDAIWSAIRARRTIPSVDHISKIELNSTKKAYDICGKDPEKWAPKSHETADHSLPYTVAVALIDGNVTLSSFDEDRLDDERTLDLMKKITVTEDPRLTAAFPGAKLSGLKITLSSGEVISEPAQYQSGHPKNPATDAQIEEKFRQNTEGFLSRNQIDKITNMVWNLETLRDTTELIETCVVNREP